MYTIYQKKVRVKSEPAYNSLPGPGCTRAEELFIEIEKKGGYSILYFLCYDSHMRITLLTYGSRGDFQPFLALAVGLQKAGHSVCLAGPRRFESFAAELAIPFAQLAGDPAELSQNFNNVGGNVFGMVRAMQEHVFPIAAQVVQQALAACRGADLLVHSFLFTSGARVFARQLDIPDVSVQTFPIFTPTRAFPNVGFPNLPPGLLSYLSHQLLTYIYQVAGNSGYQRLRRNSSLNLPEKLEWPFKAAAGRAASPLLFAFSQAVLPRPPDWKAANIHIPGYFFLDEPDYRPPAELERFLQDGEPPVCISFGSMVNRQAEKIGQALLTGLAQAGQRGIILTGWSSWKPATPPANVLYMESAPHSWLFPRCKVIVHHGGAGATGAGLRSGKPNIVVPFAVDQPFWARRVALLGAGPAPIPVKQFNARSFGVALECVLSDAAIQTRAEAVGTQIRSEDGVGNAVRLIEAHAASGQ